MVMLSDRVMRVDMDKSPTLGNLLLLTPFTPGEPRAVNIDLLDTWIPSMSLPATGTQFLEELLYGGLAEGMFADALLLQAFVAEHRRSHDVIPQKYQFLTLCAFATEFDSGDQGKVIMCASVMPASGEWETFGKALNDPSFGSFHAALIAK